MPCFQTNPWDERPMTAGPKISTSFLNSEYICGHLTFLNKPISSSINFFQTLGRMYFDVKERVDLCHPHLSLSNFASTGLLPSYWCLTYFSFSCELHAKQPKLWFLHHEAFVQNGDTLPVNATKRGKNWTDAPWFSQKEHWELLERI